MIQVKTMHRIYVFLTLLFICLFISSDLQAITSKDTPELKKDLRILELLPNLCTPLAVEPGVPANFVALSPKGILDPYDFIYWGPKDVLEAYFKNPASLKVPLIRVKLSEITAQTGPNSFDKKFMELIEKLQKEDPKGFASIETQWGGYPVLATRNIFEDHLFFTAFVGLNDPEGGWTLMFELVYPDKKGHPTKKDRQLWESLLTKTTQLQDSDYFKALGQDLQEGYTLVNVCNAKLKMLAEKRQSDGMLQVVVIPESPNVEFHYVDMEECAMGATWKHGEPMVKIYGEIIFGEKNFKVIQHYVTSIFFKTVTDFSVKKEDEEKKFLIFQKKCEKVE